MMHAYIVAFADKARIITILSIKEMIHLKLYVKYSSKETAIELIDGDEERLNKWQCPGCSSVKVNNENVDFNAITGECFEDGWDFYHYYQNFVISAKILLLMINYPNEYWYLWKADGERLEFHEHMKYNDEHKNDEVHQEEMKHALQKYDEIMDYFNAPMEFEVDDDDYEDEDDYKDVDATLCTDKAIAERDDPLQDMMDQIIDEEQKSRKTKGIFFIYFLCIFIVFSLNLHCISDTKTEVSDNDDEDSKPSTDNAEIIFERQRKRGIKTKKEANSRYI